MLLSSVFSLGSLFSPHPFPSAGPFFEGWYTRVVDGSDSFGVIFGEVLPKAGDADKFPTEYLSIMWARNGSTMSTVECVPKLVKVNNPAQAPDFLTPPAFTWSTASDGAASVTGNRTYINFRCRGIQSSSTSSQILHHMQ